MRRETKLEAPDVGVLGSVVVLLVVGVLLVFDASYAKMADAKWANYDYWYMAKRQLIWAGVGFVAMVAVSRARFSTLLKWTTPLLFISLIGLVAVLVPGVGNRVNGAFRWIRVGPVNIQPSELAKLAIVLYLAGIFAQRRLAVRRLSGDWAAPAMVVGLVAGLVFVEPDLGTVIAIVGTCFVMLYSAGALKRHLVLIFSGGAFLAGLAVVFEPYRLERVWVWLNPWRDPYGDGYQVIHALLGLGTGGLRGVGLCEGREKLYIPAASTDFIFATLGEEAGLIGGLALMAALMYFTYRGLDVGRRSKSTYGNLVAVGMTSLIGLQALINIAVVSAAIPATGVPLPFISYGGSSLVSMLIAAGILLAVSRQINVELDDKDLYENSTNGRRDGGTRVPRGKRRASPPPGRIRRRR